MIMPRTEAAVIAETCACFNLRKAARAVTQAYDDAIAPSGIKRGSASGMYQPKYVFRAGHSL